MAFPFALLLGATGCHHRKVRPVLLPPATSVPLVEVPATPDGPLVEEQRPKLPPIPVAEAAGKPKKQKKRSGKSGSVAGTVQGGGTGAAPASPRASESSVEKSEQAAAAANLGSLTVGGEQNPRALEEAADVIASNERRLSGLSAERAKGQAALVSNVRNFQKDAQVALKSGDAEGAKTLATKGRLLLDDLEK